MKYIHRQLARSVQHNCNISDARYAGNYTMCIYLLKMREYFRWEMEQDFGSSLTRDDVGRWLSEREQLWSDIEGQDYAHLDIDGELFDPFHSDHINSKLLEHGLVYSAGIGQKSKPHFFLADLVNHEKQNGYDIYISAREYARDLTSPPAMSQEGKIFIRRESFKRMIWEKTEQWRWNKPQNAMAYAIACYDFDANLERALDQMTDHELESAILHEIGEIKAGEYLQGWQTMMSQLMFTQAEIMARAVRDHLADALSTLPVLLEKQQHASIHFYMANLTSMRKHIFPTLTGAYNDWLESNDTAVLNELVNDSKNHWKNIATEMLAIFDQYGENSHEHIELLVENNTL
ncbi:MAG: Sfum_1244 family protein [Gammaproteobacteria bacterium]